MFLSIRSLVYSLFFLSKMLLSIYLLYSKISKLKELALIYLSTLTLIKIPSINKT